MYGQRIWQELYRAHKLNLLWQYLSLHYTWCKRQHQGQRQRTMLQIWIRSGELWWNHRDTGMRMICRGRSSSAVIQDIMAYHSVLCNIALHSFIVCYEFNTVNPDILWHLPSQPAGAVKFTLHYFYVCLYLFLIIIKAELLLFNRIVCKTNSHWIIWRLNSCSANYLNGWGIWGKLVISKL